MVAATEQLQSEVQQFYPSEFDSENAFVDVQLVMDSIRALTGQKYYNQNITFDVRLSKLCRINLYLRVYLYL